METFAHFFFLYLDKLNPPMIFFVKTIFEQISLDNSTYTIIKKKICANVGYIILYIPFEYRIPNIYTYFSIQIKAQK